MPIVTTAEEEDKDRIIQTIVLGFAADPFVRWMVPRADDYLRAMPALVDALASQAFANGTAFCADDGKAAGLWLGPGVEGDEEAMTAALMPAVPPDLVAEVIAMFEEMNSYHPHDEPIWFLPLLAADPACVGQGLGGALMKHALRRCDEEQLPAYLESSNLRNVSLYERHGFEAMAQIQHGSSPVVTPMLRPARR
jgi:GNAT superfamily N-acetyltransferase